MDCEELAISDTVCDRFDHILHRVYRVRDPLEYHDEEGNSSDLAYVYHFALPLANYDRLDVYVGIWLATLRTGFVQNYAGLLGVRMVLGLTQADIYPGCAYLVDSWYTRQEAQRRFSLYMCTVNLACIFGGLIAATVGEMDGLGSLGAWRWIFISEGIITCLLAVMFYFLIASFPEKVSWLTDEQRLLVKNRLKAEQGDSAIGYTIKPRDVLVTARDPKVILAGLIHLLASVPGYMGTYFASVMVERFGVHSRIEIQPHTAPVWIVAIVMTIAVGYISDKTRHRFIVILVCAIVSVAGYYAVFNVNDNVHIQYGALFLALSGMASVVPGRRAYGQVIWSLTQLVEVCWNTMNLGGHRRRAIGTAWQIGFGNFGAIIVTYALRDKGSPVPVLACIASCCVCVVFCAWYAGYCWRQNRGRRARGWGREYTEEEKARLGDLSPGYRLMI